MGAEKILTNEKFADRYHAIQLPDKKFTELLMSCFNAKQKDKIEAIDKFYHHVINAGGGFDIGKFRGREKIDNK